MKTILHILTKPEDALAEQLRSAHQLLPETKVETIRLAADSNDADYQALVKKVFQADSVNLW
jgi:hypothetical protein